MPELYMKYHYKEDGVETHIDNLYRDDRCYDYAIIPCMVYQDGKFNTSNVWYSFLLLWVVQKFIQYRWEAYQRLNNRIAHLGRYLPEPIQPYVNPLSFVMVLSDKIERSYTFLIRVFYSFGAKSIYWLLSPLPKC